MVCSILPFPSLAKTGSKVVAARDRAADAPLGGGRFMSIGQEFLSGDEFFNKAAANG